MNPTFFHFDPHALSIVIRFADGRELLINHDALQISFFSSGPGGQYANKHLNGVRLIYKIPAEYRRNAFKTQELMARSIQQRHQHQNMKIAFELLFKKLRSYFYIAPFRKKTKPSKGSKEKRLKDKHIQSRKKHERHGDQTSL